MSRTLIISDELYDRLETEARTQGFNSIEQLLEQRKTSAAEASPGQDIVRRIDDLRDRLFAKYGQMPDSIELLREDRAR